MAKRTNTAKWSDKYGRWQINVQKDGKRRSFYSSTPGRTGQRACNQKADAWLDDGVQGGRRVAQLWQQYVENTQASSSTSNVRKIQSVGENYILPAIGGKKIEAVTEGDLQAILNRAYKHGSFKKDLPANCHHLGEGETLSKKTLTGIRSTIRSFIKYCRVMCRATTLNPESLTVPQGARSKGKEILQPSGLATLFSVDTTVYRNKRVFDPHIHAYRFAVTTGVRPGELIGLRYGDAVGTQARIQRSINVYGEETRGKNENALRAVVLSPLAQQAVKEQIALLKAQGARLEYSTPLFQIEREQLFYRAWQRYCTANGIPPISLYEMRHTFMSLAKYLPAGQVKAIVGHSRAMDTFGIYGHKLTGDDEKLAQDLGEVFRKILA